MKYDNLTLLHNIGEVKHLNYHKRSQVINSNKPLGFDGIYLNVYENQDILKNKTGIFFVMGNYVGKDNKFDLKYVPKLEKYCTWDQINEMVEKYDFELGWHTWSHPDLTKLSKNEILKEMTPPFPMKYFAYPYGRYNKLTIECSKELGFEYSWSVTQGCKDKSDPNYNHKIFRNYL